MPHTKKPHKLDTLTPLSREEVEEKLRKFEKTALVGELGAGPAAATWLSYLGMNGGMAASPHKPPVVRFDTNSVNSNDPCEDYYCQHTFNGNLIFSMFDGHGGPECAALLKKYLASYIAHAVSQLPALTQDHLTSPSPNRKKAVESALKSAFKRMDADIVGGAIDVAPNSLPLNSRIKESLKSALAGSCALVAYMEGNDVYVCCTGDSRAVLGSCTSEGRFMATDLSADQTVKNPNEYGRLIDEHPGELETVVVRGRVLGGLMPTRAFGDARYKWPLDIQNKVLPALSRRSTPRNYKTPPYVTAEPEVTHYLIDPSRDKFLVLATDGLYDVLESDDVVSVVSEYMRHKNLVSPPVDKRVDKWLHVDENAATDLLRNALGGPDEERTRKLLAIPAPLSRRFRDDITINVIFFGQNAPTLSSSPSSSTVLASPENIGIGSPSDYGNLASVDLTLALAKRQRLGEWANWLDRLAKL
ncbi:phosphatase 2C-like domain-containing protein [Chytridium lagenaria]|nr:phosphatase 2C-like domain-containing protein [Chytridium lagenaria]